MTITVSMTPEEFEGFRAYQKDKKIHSNAVEEAERKINLMIKKLDMAVEPNPKKEGTYKIIDKDQMDDLWILMGKYGDEL